MSCSQFFHDEDVWRYRGVRFGRLQLWVGDTVAFVPLGAIKTRSDLGGPLLPWGLRFPIVEMGSGINYGTPRPGFSHLCVCNVGSGYQGCGLLSRVAQSRTLLDDSAAATRDEDLGRVSPLPQEARRVLCPCGLKSLG